MRNSYQNPLSIRAKRLMKDAYFEILKENPRGKIKITELCERAGLSRRTFYTHFETIEDIPKEYLSDQWTGYLESEISKSLGKGIPEEEFALLITRSGFEYWGKKAECYKLLKKAGIESILYDVICAGCEMARQLFGHKLGSISNIKDPILQKYFNSFEANTFINLFSLWVETGMQQSVDEMADIHVTLTSYNLYHKLTERFGDKQ